MQQQHQILQSLNQCYAQLQQQHQDMATLQQQFQHLFTYNPSALGENNPSLHRPQTATPSIINNASPSFMSLPSHSVLQPPLSGPLFSQAPFTSAHQAPSSASMFRTAWHPQFGQQVRSFYDLSKHSSRIVKFYKKGVCLQVLKIVRTSTHMKNVSIALTACYVVSCYNYTVLHVVFDNILVAAAPFWEETRIYWYLVLKNVYFLFHYNIIDP